MNSWRETWQPHGPIKDRDLEEAYQNAKKDIIARATPRTRKSSSQYTFEKISFLFISPTRSLNSTHNGLPQKGRRVPTSSVISQ